MRQGSYIAAATAVAVVLLAIAACGGGGNSSAEEPPKTSSIPAREFMSPGGANKYAEFGDEAGAAEREAASQVLEENLKARAAGDWAKQCASLTPEGIKKVEKEAASLVVKSGCVTRLKALAEPVVQSAAIRADTMTGPIAALRVQGSTAFALYHGAHGKDYAMPMKRIGGTWKVNALLTTEIP
jgi:hypothetical protein